MIFLPDQSTDTAPTRNSCDAAWNDRNEMAKSGAPERI